MSRPYATSKPPVASQTLVRGLELLDVVAETGSIGLIPLADRLGLTRSTAYRIASALVERRLLMQTPRQGYRLGSKLLELGNLVDEKMSLPADMRPHLEKVVKDTGDTVQLGVVEKNQTICLDKLPGRRRLQVGARIGDCQPLRSTGLGKALILGEGETRWRDLYRLEGPPEPGAPNEDEWVRQMHAAAKRDFVLEWQEEEDDVRSVAAPVRSAEGQIIAAISVSSSAKHMADDRMHSLGGYMRDTAYTISRDLGWDGERAAAGSH